MMDDYNIENGLERLDDVLPESVERVQGPPEAPPIDYFDNFQLPAHYRKPLEALNDDPLAARLKFFEEEHVYTFDDVPLSDSSTKEAHQFEHEFDADACISRMSMPRFGLVVDQQEIASLDDATPDRGVLVVSGNTTVAAMNPCALHPDATTGDIRIFLDMVRKAESTEPERYYTFSRVCTAEEIKKKWSDKGREASAHGTDAHHQCELYLNGLPCRWWEAEMKILFAFIERELLPRGIQAFNTEKEIVCVDADLGGSIDAIFYDPKTQLHHIVDFKRSDKLADGIYGYGSKRLKPPMSHLDESKATGFALQLGIYQYILERDYGFRIGDRILLSIHPDKPFITSVPYLYAEVDYIMRKRFALVQARRMALQADPRFACSLTGAPVVDAVRLGDGRIAMEKAAAIRKLEFTADEDIRSEFESAVKQHMPSVPTPPPAQLLPWRSRMPKNGLPPFD